MHASNDAKQRDVVWKDLEDIIKETNSSWMVVEDYNCVLYPNERIGSIVKHQEVERLQQCVHRYGLRDMACTGNKFIWNNK